MGRDTRAQVADVARGKCGADDDADQAGDGREILIPEENIFSLINVADNSDQRVQVF